ncbi:MAG: DUF1015 family protein, partial [Elusimicrobia bacterium]|nr:DUF1015 family protein [Elusimicrobiota bacterium]
FADRAGGVTRLLAAAKRARPLASGRDAQGLPVRLWRLDDPRAVAALERLLARETLLIADGHHRYEVGRAYWEATRRRGAGRLLAFLVSERDPGLVVLPTHRVVKPTPALRRRLTSSCCARPVRSLTPLARAASPYAFVLGEGKGLSLMTPRPGDKGVRSGFATDWLARRLLAGVDPHDIAYFHDAADALREARRTGALALVLKDFAVGDIRRAVLKAGLLPQKSTYFHPKVPTGLAFRSFDLDP